MKKIMFAAAVAAAGLAFGVESANTVGYVSKAGVLGNVWTIVPCQFEATGTVDIDLNAYVKGDFVKTVSFYDEGWENLAPQIQQRAADGTTSFFYYLKDAYVEGGDPSELEGWANYNGDYVPVTTTLEPGVGFWFRPTAQLTIQSVK